MNFSHFTTLPIPDPDAADEAEGMQCVRDALAVLDAISLGELFAALPASQGDRMRHQTGIVLLELLRRRLNDALKGADY